MTTSWAVGSREEPKARLDQIPWSRVFERGIERCRASEWELGLEDLVRVYGAVRRSDLPGLFYSYMGLGVARMGQLQRGVKLCHRAIEVEFYQPENYVNLARAELLAKNRSAAWQAVAEGLVIDPKQPQLLTLRQELGARKPPVIPFFSRGNLLNRMLGRLRHDLRHKPKPAEKEEPVKRKPTAAARLGANSAKSA